MVQGGVKQDSLVGSVNNDFTDQDPDDPTQGCPNLIPEVPVSDPDWPTIEVAVPDPNIPIIDVSGPPYPTLEVPLPHYPTLEIPIPEYPILIPEIPKSSPTSTTSTGTHPIPHPTPKPTSPPKPPPCVIQITAMVPGTRAVRSAHKWTDNVLTPSSSKQKSLAANPPVILIRGCTTVQLTAVTTPPNLPVTWTVEQNENTNSPPAITPQAGGRKAILATNQAGSFAVIATLGSCKVIWNVVFAWVEVQIGTSNIVAPNTHFHYNALAGFPNTTEFDSGDDNTGQSAWQARVTVKVHGGGTSGKLGIEKVVLNILQNGVADTLTGHYNAGQTAHETVPSGLPIVDATAGGNPYKVFPDNINPTTGDTRQAFTADSPGGAFDNVHTFTHAAGTSRLQSISGSNNFKTAIASNTDDAPNSINVHADARWSAVFNGTVNAAGVYHPTTAKIIKTDTKFRTISAGTGGQDAHDANYETWVPIFRTGVTTTWTP